jgi:hypothetical protein
MNDHRTLEKERTAFDKEANIIAGQVSQVPRSKQKQTREAAANTKVDLYEIQLATRSIQELKEKREALQSVFDQERVMWKTQRQRLLALVEQFEVENETLKLTIEQARVTIEESSIEDTVIPNPESRLFQALSPRQGRPMPSSNTALDRAIAAQSIPPPRPQDTEIVPFTDFNLEFDYWPSGEGVASTDGREIKYGNGDIVLKFRDGRKKLKRAQCNHVWFTNGDVQIDFDDGRVAYRYKQTSAIEVTLNDGTTHCLFRTGQREVRFRNGDKYVVFPDFSTKYSKSNGDYRITRPNGVIESCISGVISRSGPSESP